MPYIKPERANSALSQPVNPGELNYAFTEYINRYLDHSGLSYRAMNDILGALEACKLEFYRRVVVPYEERKIEDNGDVYNYD